METTQPDDPAEELARLVQEQAAEEAGTSVFRTRKTKVPERYGTDPLEDAWGRGRYVVSRLCWCSLSAPTDCRFHSMKDPAWQVCPSKGPYGSEDDPHVRKLWAYNPRFGKVPDETEPGLVRTRDRDGDGESTVLDLEGLVAG